MTSPATPRPLPPLTIGPLTIGTPVVLAPMAGITNRAFRRLCRRFAAGGLPSGSGCLYISEMITSRALAERAPATMRLIEFDADESPRSMQLYGVDPATMARAAEMVAGENLADHIDLNFGCPVPKVTRKGGGAALPWKTSLFGQIVAATVRAAARGGIPVTVKMRLGIDEDHITYLDAARQAEDAGAAAIALHARTAAEAYSGRAHWPSIARLKEAVRSVPVLGNGDIWSAQDALDMVAATGCDGVVVGRGCLGRPWLFAELAAAFNGSELRLRPDLGQVAAVMRTHASYLAEFYGDERRAARDIRKHIAWYLKGFRAGSQIRHQLALVTDLAALDELLAGLDPGTPWPGEPAEGPRGRAGSARAVALPEGWLDSRDVGTGASRALAGAEVAASGG